MFPLKFHFPDTSIDKFLDTYPKAYEVLSALSNIDNLSFDELTKLKADMYEMQIARMKNLGILDSIRPRPFSKDIDDINKRINNFAPQEFSTPIIMSKDDIVNGYNLFNIDYNIMAYDDFVKYKKMWNDDEKMSHEEFINEYQDTACSDWNKMDEHGECFAGFWEYPDGSHEKENASGLTRDKNGECLWLLPYPKKFVLETILLGCNNRQECVKYSNFLCEWMRRKILQFCNL